MGASLVITTREGVEASLILAVVSAYLTKTSNGDRLLAVWLGTVAALGASVLLGAAVFILAGELSGRPEEAFEGLSMALTAVILSYVILWMRRQGRYMARDLESKLSAALELGSFGALAGLAFFAVFREGAETVLYLLAGRESTGTGPMVAGAGLGLLLVLGLGYLIFQGSHRLNLRLFFNATGIILLIFAAGLVGKAAAAFQVVGIFPGTINAWDTRWLLDDQGLLGGIAGGLLGYTSAPSLLQVMFYVAYLAVVGHLYLEEGSAIARERQEPFVPLGSSYDHRLYRLLRQGRLTIVLPAAAAVAMAGLLAIALLGIDVGPFSNEGPLSVGPFVGPENGDNLFNLAIWVVWMPLLLISALALGRLWCGNVCPLRLVTDAGRSLGDWLRGRSRPTSPYLRMGWVLPLSFILITYFVKSWPIQTEARLGAYMFLTIFALAFLVGAVFRRGTWCRYLCPVGGWLARISRLSAIAVRPNADICAGCVDKPCLAGTVAGRCPSYLNPSHLDSSRYCLECWVCVRSCPIEKSSMKVGWRLPGTEIARPTAPDIWESVFIAALLGMYVAVAAPSRWAGVAAAPWSLVFFGFMGIAAVSFVSLCLVAAALRAVPFREALTTFGYIFLPLEFAAAVLTFGDDALEFFNIMVPAAGVLLTVGFAWSALLGASILRYRAPTTAAALRGALPVGVALTALLFLWLSWYACGTVVDLT